MDTSSLPPPSLRTRVSVHLRPSAVPALHLARHGGGGRAVPTGIGTCRIEAESIPAEHADDLLARDRAWTKHDE